MGHYNGFSYEEFYEFIIDFFEADTTPEGLGVSGNLLEWWNKYIFSFTFTLIAADTAYSPGECFRGLQQHMHPNPSQHSKHRLQPCSSNVRLPSHLTHPRSSCNTHEICFLTPILLSITN